LEWKVISIQIKEFFNTINPQVGIKYFNNDNQAAAVAQQNLLGTTPDSCDGIVPAK